jgi:hypothetical protein
MKTLEKCSILVKIKEGENFNPGIYGIFRGLKIEPDLSDWPKGDIFPFKPFNVK